MMYFRQMPQWPHTGRNLSTSRGKNCPVKGDNSQSDSSSVVIINTSHLYVQRITATISHSFQNHRKPFLTSRLQFHHPNTITLTSRLTTRILFPIAVEGRFLLNLARTAPLFPCERVILPQMTLMRLALSCPGHAVFLEKKNNWEISYYIACFQN